MEKRLGLVEGTEMFGARDVCTYIRVLEHGMAGISYYILGTELALASLSKAVLRHFFFISFHLSAYSFFISPHDMSYQAL
jgi:hypothetical protein